MIPTLTRDDWDAVFAAHPEPVELHGERLVTEPIVQGVRKLAEELTRPQRLAIPILLAGPLLYAPSEHPRNDKGYVRHDVLRRLVDRELAVVLPEDTNSPNPVYGYGATALTYAVDRIATKPKKRRRSSRKKFRMPKGAAS